MANKIVKETYGAPENQILFMTRPMAAVGAVIGNTGVTADSDGNKILKAGTPVSGDLTKRTTAFVKATTSGNPAASNAVGVLEHDVDVTAGAENGSVLLFGFVNLERLDTATVALITDEVKAALDGKITFLK